MIIKAESLQVEAKDLLHFPRVGDAADSQYFCPTYSWAKDFLTWIAPQIQLVIRRLQNKDFPGLEGFDCDNVTRRVIDRATDFFILRNDLAWIADHAIFAAEIAISPLGAGLNGIPHGEHETNLIRTSDKGWVFAEGQTGFLSDANIAINSGDVIPRYLNLGV